METGSMMKQLSGQHESREGRWATYKRVGDVLIGPWSSDLGVTGLKPVEAKAEQALGEWTSAGGKRVIVKEAEKEGDGLTFKGLGMIGPRPSKEGIERMVSELTLDAGEKGIHRKVYGWNCMMAHMDHGGVIYWFLTVEGKLVRVIFPAYCDGGSGGWAQDGEVEVFEKKGK